MEQIKFQVHPKSFAYFLSFDLAKIHTGWSLCNFNEDKLTILEVGVIDMSNARPEEFWLEYYRQLSRVFSQFLPYKEKMLVLKERMPMQNGRFSSIAALQALAQCHAVFDLLVAQFGFIIYDTEGIPAISEKALFRQLTGKDKVEKTDIREFILSHSVHKMQEDVSLDITDSIAVTMTLCLHTAEQDIKKELAEIRKQKKQYKSAKKIAQLEERETALQHLLKGD